MAIYIPVILQAAGSLAQATHPMPWTSPSRATANRVQIVSRSQLSSPLLQRFRFLQTFGQTFFRQPPTRFSCRSAAGSSFERLYQHRWQSVTDGTVDAQCAVPEPGFTGQRGDILFKQGCFAGSVSASGNIDNRSLPYRQC